MNIMHLESSEKNGITQYPLTVLDSSLDSEATKLCISSTFTLGSNCRSDFTSKLILFKQIFMINKSTSNPVFFFFPVKTITTRGDENYGQDTSTQVLLGPEDLNTPHTDQEKGTMRMQRQKAGSFQWAKTGFFCLSSMDSIVLNY